MRIEYEIVRRVHASHYCKWSCCYYDDVDFVLYKNIYKKYFIGGECIEDCEQLKRSDSIKDLLEYAKENKLTPLVSKELF